VEPLSPATVRLGRVERFQLVCGMLPIDFDVYLLPFAKTDVLYASVSAKSAWRNPYNK
jgi:hypothetical protein